MTCNINRDNVAICDNCIINHKSMIRVSLYDITFGLEENQFIFFQIRHKERYISVDKKLLLIRNMLYNKLYSNKKYGK